MTSISPFSELNAIDFCGLILLKVTSNFPFSACATALPEILFSVTEPFTSSTSMSPFTPVTTMSPSFTARRFSDVCTGTEIDRSIGRMCDSVLMWISLFSSSTESPVDDIAMRFGPAVEPAAIAIARPRFDDHFFAVVGLHGDPAGDQFAP